MRAVFFIYSYLVISTAAQAALVLHCGSLFDSKSAEILGPHTILIENESIKKVMQGLNHFEGESVDLRQSTCLPGFIDLHVHLSSQTSKNAYEERFRLDDTDLVLASVPYAEKTLLAGFTSVRDAGGEIALSLRNAINKGHIRGPRIFAAGKAIASTGGHADPTNGISRTLSETLKDPGPKEGVINGTDDAKKAVRHRYKEGSDLIKITATGGVLSLAKSADGPQFSLDELKAIVSTAKDYGFTVAAHAHGKEGMKRAIIAGVTSIEHGTYMDEELFALMKKHNTWFVPTLSAGDFVAKKAELDDYYPQVVRPKAKKIGPQIAATLAKAYKAGVKIAFGTDAGVFFHGDNADEFVLMVKAGMPAHLALQSATYNAAQLLPIDNIGQIREGFKADIVAVSGNPVNQIELTKNVHFVMKDGTIYKR